MNVLLINGHPRKGSFTEALVNAYAAGACEAGVNLTTLRLYEQDFDLNVTHFTPAKQQMEPAIINAQALISQADHVVFVYPTWWGTMPALLKGFIDRVFTAGFAFEDIEGGTGYAPLLRGKTAQIITTMDTPALVYQLIYRAPGHHAMRNATLEFCGFDMSRTLRFGPVKDSDVGQRQKWLHTVQKEGLKLRNGSLPSWNRFTNKTITWLKAIRLQFYPMTCLAYATGAFAADLMGYGFNLTIFWIGYLWLFLLELATVLSNDYLDYQSDAKNKFFSPFTGGSRVLVDKLLSFREVKLGILISLGLSFLVLAYLLSQVPVALPEVLLTCGILFVLAMGYTVPPLRLSYRGLGEITVGLTHSFLVVLCGYLFQGGPVTDAAPWLLSLPMFFAVLPSIILSGSPDYEADKAAGKRTLAVRFGKRGAARLALIFTWVAAVIVIVLTVTDPVPPTFHYLAFPVIIHAAYLCYRLYRYLQHPNPKSRIDSLMVVALTYLIWFALIPVINLW